MTIAYGEFERVQIHVGRVQRAEPFAEARRPALKLWIDFGPVLGVRRTSAQITRHYTAADLPGRMVLAVTNFAPKQIGRFMSEVLVLGVPDEDGEIILLRPDQDVPVGGRVS
jgi:tRNA-binding protein